MDLPGLASDALRLALVLSMPALVAGLAAGLLVTWFELAGPGLDASVGFLPRLLAVSAALFFGGEALGAELTQWTSQLFAAMAQLAR